MLKNRKLKFMCLILIILIGFTIGLYYNKNTKEELVVPKCVDCNVILIDLSNVRSDHLSCYGYFRNTSQNIDDLARDGVVFKNAFSQSCYPLPSVMSMFTSLYPSSYKVDQEHKLNPSIATLPQILKFYNYTTVWIGPIDDPNFPLENGVGRGFEKYYYACVSVFSPQVIYWTDALNWLENNANKTKFFMYLHSYRSQPPYVPSDEVIKKFTNKINPRIISSYEKLMEVAWKKIDNDPSLIFKKEAIEKNSEIFNMNYSYEKKLKMFELNKNSANIKYPIWNFLVHDVLFNSINVSSPEDVEYLRVLYDATIFESDLDVKHIVEKIDETGVRNKTIIIITSDHGEELVEHGHICVLHKNSLQEEAIAPRGGSLYEEAIHTPLIFALPNFKLDKPVEGLVQGIDIMPTVLDLLNITIPAQAQGISLLPMIENREDAPRNEYVYGVTKTDKVSIRSKEWKYIVDLRKNQTELYDLINDPGETNNLVTIRKDVAKMFEQELEKFLERTSYPKTAEFPIWVGNETKDRIEKEGYW